MIIDNIEKLDLLPDNERQLVISLLDLYNYWKHFYFYHHKLIHETLYLI